MEHITKKEEKKRIEADKRLQAIKEKYMKKEINYYGTKDNYIHLKFGHARKAYNFTGDFVKKYPDFTKSYENYWNDTPEGEDNDFYSAFDVVAEVFDNNIPVHFYFNFTDTPAKSREEIEQYLTNEN